MTKEEKLQINARINELQAEVIRQKAACYTAQEQIIRCDIVIAELKAQLPAPEKKKSLPPGPEEE